MKINYALLACFASLLVPAAWAQQEEIPIFNTVKLKLANGQSVIGGTIDAAEPATYCAMANAGFDFMWIEMQHSPLNYSQVAEMIWACRDAPAIPFIRIPEATEGDIQKALDIGALGIIVPMVDAIEEIETAVTYAKYPPMGKRSLGGGQYGALWGRDYRRAANDNIMVVAMIEQVEGVDIIDQVVNTPGVDAVFVASSDLSSFTGLRQGDPEYEALVSRVLDTTLAAGLTAGGPLNWLETREGYGFFQGPGAGALIRAGTRVSLESADPCRFLPSGTSPVAGEDPCP
ncbi:MAG: aldolase/citrate lyase family protein [Gammaproteobacteria bacterium]|nr:aldolase/citrate lyase family protein [Gammaproteobacteria bacterium]